VLKYAYIGKEAIMEKILCSIYAQDGSFTYEHKTHKERGIAYKPHNHSGYEVFLLLKGEGLFMVEGTGYLLKPMDIIITRSDEIHEISYDEVTEYDRVVIHVEDSFFEKFDCLHYTEIFNNRKIGENNLIDHDSVKKSELFDTLKRLEKYIKSDTESNIPVVQGVMIEFLHQLNEFKTAGGVVRSETVKTVMEYINSNIGETLLLDHLADMFFISKYHLCRSFKKYTGLTVNQYITYRRLMLVRELHSQGKSLSVASMESGFSSYSSFYKAYTKETGYAPSEGMGRKN
jgi:AraC-like DNA-binding protein